MILTEQEVDALRKSLPAVCKHQDVIRAAESAVLEKLKTQEPFGYFRADAFCWTDCAETDDGAKPLYEHPLPPDDVVQKYEELLYAVHRKFPDETRHQTALRYIKTAESPSYTNAAMKEMK